MPESTPIYVDCKPCQECGKVKPLSSFVKRGAGRSRTCCQCLGLPVVPDGHKYCAGCDEVKPLSDFYARPGRPGKTMNRCKPCSCGYRRDRYADNPERYRAERRDYYWRDPEASRAASARWRLENPLDPEAQKQRRRAQYLADPAKAYERSSQWRLANPERWREINRDGAARRRAANPEPSRTSGRRASSRRRARVQNLPCEPYTMAELLERDGTDCVLCGEPLDLTASYPEPLAPTVEHLECLSWPDATAGDVPSNVALSHFRCNCQRGDRPHPAAARKRAELLAIQQAERPGA